MKKYKWLVFSVLCILIVIISFILGFKTKDESYTALFAIPIIICLFLAACFLFKFHEDHYTDNSFEHKKKLIKNKIDSFESIFIKSEELYYFLNRKIIGGEEVLIKHNDNIHFISRQVYAKAVSRYKRKYTSFYSFDCERYGSYIKLKDDMIKKGIIIDDISLVEIVALEGKKPFQLKEKHDFSKIKIISPLYSISLIGIVVGIIFIFISSGFKDQKDVIESLIFGISTFIIGIICLIITFRKIKKETLVK